MYDSFGMSPFFRQPLLMFEKLRKAWRCFQEGGWYALKARVVTRRSSPQYQEWVRQFDTLPQSDYEAVRAAAELLSHKPKISIITPVFNPSVEHLRACMDSVLGQAYHNWELCVADDCSTDPNVRRLIEEYRAKDPRVKVIYRETSGHISAASNSAISIATGEYMAFLDHDDELTVDALYLVALEINHHPDAQLIYSDEDKKTPTGERIEPHFKSDWNPELLLHQNYICHLLVVKKDIVAKVGGLRSTFDGAQDWDLILRVSELVREPQIRHIPHILYHWRVSSNSTALSTSAKPYVLEAQARAVQEHLNRTGQHALARFRHAPSHICVERELQAPEPGVSLIVLPTDGGAHLGRCIDTLVRSTSYKRYEVLVIDTGGIERETLSRLERVRGGAEVKILQGERSCTLAALANLGARHATGELVGFLGERLASVKPLWLEKMVAQGVRKEVGAVGARILLTNNRVEHCGSVLGIGDRIGYSHRGRAREDYGYFNRAVLSQCVSAASAECLLLRRDVFESVHGFDEQFSHALYDVDLCLRLRQAGFSIIYEPDAEIYLHPAEGPAVEMIADQREEGEGQWELLKNRWGGALVRDPYYNPNLTGASEDFALAFPPRVQRAWREGYTR
ncbi:MAG: hypothetical protein RL518_2431, partial [Pseudomonadota bacterium]